MRIRVLSLAAAGVFLLMGGAALAASNDQQKNATELSAGRAVSPKLVREWDPYLVKVELGPDDKPITIVGGWRDQGDDNAAVTNQMGGYWFYVKQLVGQDQVIALTLKDDMEVGVSSAGDATLHPDFSRTAHEGTVYYYVQKSAWKPFHEAGTYYFRIFSAKKGSVGEEFKASFKAQSIKDFVPFPGSLEYPIEIPQTDSGSLTVEAPTDYLLFYGYKFWTTTYSATLKANTAYTFRGDNATADGMEVFVRLYEGEWGDGFTTFPGRVVETWNAQHSAVTCLQLMPNRDVRTKILVSPDIHHNALTAAGRTLYWSKGDIQTEVETFVGCLQSVDPVQGGSRTAAFFEVDVKTIFGSTNLSACVTVGSRRFVQEGLGAGKFGDGAGSVFSVTSVSDSKLHIEGSLHVPGEGELFFAGDLQNGAYDVCYDPGEGSGTMAARPCRWGKVYSLDDCTFTPPGGKPSFVGWRQVPKSGVGGKFYDPGMMIYNLLHEGDGKVVFRAVWR